MRGLLLTWRGTRPGRTASSLCTDWQSKGPVLRSTVAGSSPLRTRQSPALLSITPGRTGVSGLRHSAGPSAGRSTDAWRHQRRLKP